jgi:coproporphyrinogen III oxidase-like Fe-S oxidoreductase
VPSHGPFGARIKQPPLKGWLTGAEPEIDVLDADSYILERLLTGLRTRAGVDLVTLAERSGATLEAIAPRWLKDATLHGLLRREGDTLTATPTGIQRLDAVMRAYVGSRRLVGAVSGP